MICSWWVSIEYRHDFEIYSQKKIVSSIENASNVKRISKDSIQGHLKEMDFKWKKTFWKQTGIHFAFVLVSPSSLRIETDPLCLNRSSSRSCPRPSNPSPSLNSLLLRSLPLIIRSLIELCALSLNIVDDKKTKDKTMRWCPYSSLLICTKTLQTVQSRVETDKETFLVLDVIYMMCVADHTVFPRELQRHSKIRSEFPAHFSSKDIVRRRN